jgi:hypothetical protein
VIDFKSFKSIKIIDAKIMMKKYTKKSNVFKQKKIVKKTYKNPKKLEVNFLEAYLN